MDWKGKLREIKPTLPEGKKPEPKSPEVKKPASSVAVPVETEEGHQRTNAEEFVRALEVVKQSTEFKELVRGLDIKDKETAYYKLARELLYISTGMTSGPVFGLRNFLNRRVAPPEVTELVSRLLRSEAAHDAYRIWQTAQPERMQYGTSTREERLEEAEALARKAEMPLDEIVKMWRTVSDK